MDVEAIIISVISMLNNPNIEGPANFAAALEWRDNYDQYRKKVKKLSIESLDHL